MYDYDGDQPQNQTPRPLTRADLPLPPDATAQPVQPQPTQRMLRIPTVKPIATYVLLALIVVAYLFQMQEMQESYNPNYWPLFKWGIADFERILSGEYYRLISSMFLHLNAAHIGMNAYALWVIGVVIERFFGRTRFLLIYFIAGVAGSVLEFALSKGDALGASGAIFGIFGAQLAFLLRNRKFFGPAADRDLRNLAVVILINVVFNVVSLLSPSSIRLGVWAHAGGFLVGLGLAWFIGPRYKFDGDPMVPDTVRIVDEVKPNFTWLVSAASAASVVVIFLVAVSILKPIYLITY
jgi:rhomboid protease GluP